MKQVLFPLSTPKELQLFPPCPNAMNVPRSFVISIYLIPRDAALGLGPLAFNLFYLMSFHCLARPIKGKSQVVMVTCSNEQLVTFYAWRKTTAP